MARKTRSKTTSRKSPATMVKRRVEKPQYPKVEVSPERLVLPKVKPGLVSRAGIAPRLEAAELATLLHKHKVSTMGGDLDLGEFHVELSAAVPWVEGRGWLNAIGTLRSWLSRAHISFMSERWDVEDGTLEIWLDGLTPGDAYVAQIRVGMWSGGPDARFCLSSNDANKVEIRDGDVGQSIIFLLPKVTYTLSLITINTIGCGGWLFDDVLVQHIV